MAFKPLGTFFVLLCFWFRPYAQDVQVQSISIADGLSQGYISSLFEDSRGYIWIGTLQGLNRYDGYQIKRYNPDLSKKWALKASFIYCIVEDRKGLLWIGTEKGIAVFDPYTERFVHLAEFIENLPQELVSKIIEMPNGDIVLLHGHVPACTLVVLRPPGDLRMQIREDRVHAGRFQVLHPSFAPEVKLPLIQAHQFEGTGLLAIDALNQFCRVDPNGYRVQRIDPETAGYRETNNLGWFYNPRTKGGALFLQRTADGKRRITPANSWPYFLQLPDSTRVLIRATDNQLYILGNSVSDQHTLGLNSSGFYETQKRLVALDKPCSYAAMVDHAGNLWVGTTGYGVRKISLPLVKYRQILPEKSIYNFVPLPNGKIWPGLYTSQYTLDLKSGKLEFAPWHTTLPLLRAFGMLVASDSSIWMAGFEQDTRLFIFRKNHGGSTWERLPIELTARNDLPVQLVEDRHGKIWVAGNDGELLRIDPGTAQFERWNIAACFPNGWSVGMRSNCLVESGGNQLWLATNRGFIQVSQTDGNPVFKSFFNEKTSPRFNNEYILSIYPDPANPNILWLGTRGGGLNRFDIQGGPTQFFTVSDGLPDNVVYGILPDSSGRLWLSTNRGLTLFNPKTGQFVNLAEPGMALFTEFNTCAYRTLPTGELAFGSIQGLFILKPESLRQLVIPGIVTISKFSINGLPVDPSSADPRMSLNAENIFSLSLPYDQNNLSIEFSALRNSNPASVKYRYRMAGLTDKWVETGRQRSINLAAIPPGGYTLELQCTVPGLGWNDVQTTRIRLRVQPPWYRSVPAILAYVLLGFALIRLYLHFDRRRMHARHEKTLQEKELQRFKQLDDFKKRFFSYIAHEFKTPLTLILGMADRLSRDNLPPQQAGYAEKIRMQGRNMLELVNQVLDIGKLDEGTIQLNWQLGNITTYLQARVEAMRPLAMFKNIRLQFETTAPELELDFDHGRLKHVLNNLLTNAIRHTPEGGTVRVSVEQGVANQVHIRVTDNGPGIASEELPHIFNRYYQGQANRRDAHHEGLGLAYVKDLIDLFGGSISVESPPDKRGTVFLVSLPIRRSAPPADYMPAAKDVPKPIGKSPIGQSKGRSDQPVLLVVEDNVFISEHLNLCLADHFQLDFATDGRAGFERALASIPDLVLTDVMMPEMDGLELTARLKSNALTSHIPVVVLSAKSEIADRLAGHSHGANAYIGKPFDEGELRLVLQNLHALQGQWRLRYERLAESSDPLGQLADLPQPDQSESDEFMLNLYRLFEKNYANEKYDLNQLCRDFQISRSQLQRKLAALSNHSAMTLLRRFRLQKAYILLEQFPEKNIKEICYLVGFKDPAHFTRMFSKEFNRPPSSVRSTP
ncbi:MAG: response regulator [Lewinellaceae bacterium]|nr:response regulator [Lewinellaceae bacterium]